jgi:hypothetical protein
MSGETTQHFERTAVVDDRAADRSAKRFASLSRGCKIPAIIKPEYLESPSRPRGWRKTEGERRQARSEMHSYLKPRASSLKPSPKRTRSELIISSIQLLSCGAHERCSPLKSKEDSANAVGVAPMALPLDLAMRVWDSWPKAVGLTGNNLALPCQSSILQPVACGHWVVAARPERFTA